VWCVCVCGLFMYTPHTHPTCIHTLQTQYTLTYVHTTYTSYIHTHTPHTHIQHIHTTHIPHTHHKHTYTHTPHTHTHTPHIPPQYTNTHTHTSHTTYTHKHAHTHTTHTYRYASYHAHIPHTPHIHTQHTHRTYTHTYTTHSAKSFCGVACVLTPWPQARCFIYFCIYLWLCWVFVIAYNLSLVGVCGLLIAVGSLVAELGVYSTQA